MQRLEIERKYLLREVPPEARTGATVEIEQGYLAGTRRLERLRRMRSKDGVAYYRTVKSGAGVTRVELEEEMPPELFEAMWPLTSGRRLTKRRMRVPHGALTWEIDEFTERRLVLAEVELPSEETPVVFPPWLAGYVVREVTHDPAYLNATLAR